MDQKTRESLSAQLEAIEAAEKAIDEAAAPLRAQVKPFDEATANFQQVRDSLLEQHGIEELGKCEGCEMRLFTGDLGHQCVDGPILCADCSPTWGNIKEERSEVPCEDPEDEEERLSTLAAVDAHVAAGGSLADKHAYPL